MSTGFMKMYRLPGEPVHACVLSSRSSPVRMFNDLSFAVQLSHLTLSLSVHQSSQDAFCKRANDLLVRVSDRRWCIPAATFEKPWTVEDPLMNLSMATNLRRTLIV